MPNRNAIDYGKEKVARSATVTALSGQLVRPLVKLAPALASLGDDDVAEQIVNPTQLMRIAGTMCAESKPLPDHPSLAASWLLCGKIQL